MGSALHCRYDRRKGIAPSPYPSLSLTEEGLTVGFSGGLCYDKKDAWQGLRRQDRSRGLIMDKLTRYSTEELKCPQCGKVHMVKRYAVVNVTEKPELKEQVLMNKLFVFHCDQCDLTAPLTYETVYVDSKKQLLIYLAPEKTSNVEKSLAEWQKLDFRHKRLVDNLNDLKEKILIADNLLDDRIVEFMKIEHLKQLENEMKDDNLLNILFDYQGTQYYLMVFFEKKGIGRIPVSQEYYRDVEHRYSHRMGRKIDKNFMEVDMRWAGDIMFDRN